MALLSGATFSASVFTVSITPPRAIPTNALSTIRSGMVNTCFSVWATKIQPRNTRRNSDADSDITALLPTRSAMGPHTRTNSTCITLLSTTSDMTTGSSSSRSVSM